MGRPADGEELRPATSAEHCHSPTLCPEAGWLPMVSGKMQEFVTWQPDAGYDT